MPGQAEKNSVAGGRAAHGANIVSLNTSHIGTISHFSLISMPKDDALIDFVTASICLRLNWLI